MKKHILSLILIVSYLNWLVEAAVERPKPILLSIEKYVELALEKSLESQSAKESFLSSRYSWMATNRTLTWPTLNLAAAQESSFTDNDEGTETDKEVRNAQLSLNQPFLSGAKLSLSGNWTESETETDTLGALSESRTRQRPDVQASLTQPLYVFQRNDALRSRKEARLSLENAQDTFRNSILSIEFDARSRYYTLLLNQQSLEVERKKYESARLVHNMTTALVKAGKLAKVELLRSDIRAKTDERRIQNTEINFDKELNQAKDLILYPIDTPVRLSSQLRYTPFTVPLDTLIDVAVKKNPPLNIARRQLELARLSLQQTKEGNNPDVNVNGTYGKTYDRSDLSDPSNPYSWSAGLNLTWPFFDATQTYLQSQQSEISYRNTARALETEERQLRVNIENLYLDIKRIEDQIVNFGLHRESATQSLVAIRLQYRNGLARLTDVFDAENQLRDIDLEYLRLLVDFNTARDRLSLLTGEAISKMEGKGQ